MIANNRLKQNYILQTKSYLKRDSLQQYRSIGNPYTPLNYIIFS
jgi:hypothetical protein